jgi:la-related protein 1
MLNINKLKKLSKPGSTKGVSQSDRLISTSAPEIDSFEWFKVKSKKEKSIIKKQQKREQHPTSATKSTSASRKQSSTVASTKISSAASTSSNQNAKDNREELDFMFDEEIGSTSASKPSTYAASTPKVKNSLHALSSTNRRFEDSYSSDSDSDDDEYDGDEIDDKYIQKLVIITQTPPASRKHGGMDRTGDFLPRSKITADLAKEINDGLFYYEQNLLKKSDLEKNIGLVSSEEFKKLKNNETDKNTNLSDKQTDSSKKQTR